MRLHPLIYMAIDPLRMLAAQGMTADSWQRKFLFDCSPRIMLNCCRGAGKSRVTAVRAAHQALFYPGSLTLLIARAQRQALELFRYTKQTMRALDWPSKAVKQTETQLELANGSRIISLPGKEANIRSYQGVSLLIIDEAARVPDDLYAAVSPMTGISKGRQILLSTPFGQNGFFWREWQDARANWARYRVTWDCCPRYSPAFIDDERRKFGANWVAQEYECSFTVQEGLVYTDFDKCLIDQWPSPTGRAVGGIDFGWRNPFAAVWGVLDHDDVLWIGAERYLRQTPLHEHKQALPKNVLWYADPAGRTEIEELRIAGLKVLPGRNDIRSGIAAVTARIRSGGLKVLATGCPNLIAEASRYRYPAAHERTQTGENPVDDNNHALGALRYLISRIDGRGCRVREAPGAAAGIALAER